MKEQEYNFYQDAANALSSVFNSSLLTSQHKLYYTVEELHGLVREQCDPSSLGIPVQTFIARLDIFLHWNALSIQACRFTRMGKQVRGFSVDRLKDKQ